MKVRMSHDTDGCDDATCGYLPDCSGNRTAMRHLATLKLRAIADGSCARSCVPATDDEWLRLFEAAAETR